ncbi:secreted protein containing Radical SAM domain protein, partial [Candidatus Magnetomorum sp. HK-1]
MNISRQKKRTRIHNYWIKGRETLLSNLAALLPMSLPFLGCRPFAANLRLTHRCSGRCKTCSHWHQKESHFRELSTQTWKDILDQLRDHKVLTVSFTGGDILLRKDTPVLMRYAKALGFQVRATLNGYSMTEHIAQDLMAARPDDISLSLDHFDEFFSGMRGVANATDKVLQALDLLRKHNLGHTRLGLSVTLMKNSLKGCEDLVRFALEKELFVSFNLIHFTHYFSNTPFSREQYYLSDHELSEIKQFVDWLIGLSRSHSKLLPHAAYLRWIPRYFNDYRQTGTPCLKTMLKPCIDPDGSIRPCCSMDPVGNITHNPLKTILCSPAYLQTATFGLTKNCPGCSCHYSLNLGANLLYRFQSGIRGHEISDTQEQKLPTFFVSFYSGMRHVKNVGELMYQSLLDLSDRLNAMPTDQITTGSRPTIVFQAYSVHLAQFFSSIIHTLRSHDVNMGFQILYHPQFSHTEIESLRRFATDHLGIEPGSITVYPNIPTHSIDLLVCADVYARFPRQTNQTCIIFHGPLLQRRNFKYFPFRKNLYQFDKAIVTGSYDLRLIQKYRAKYRKNFEAVVGGFPYLDTLTITPVLSKMAYYQKLGLDLNLPTIFIGPNWRGLRLFQNQGLSYIKELIHTFRNIEANILIKLHACSYNPHMAGGLDWRESLKDLASQGNIHVDSDPDDKSALMHSEILITDISSRAFIFMLLGKPVIQYFPVSKTWDHWEQSRLAYIKQGSLVAKTTAEIPKLFLK